MAVKQTAGRDALGEFASKFAEINDDVLFGQVWSREDRLSLRDRSLVTVVGLLMILMAMISLCFGAGGGHFAAVASSGFAKNIRKKLFDKIQDFSFANVDRFSTASLVTRLTTDVTNTQNSFANIIRGMIRGPLMLICAVIMAVSINEIGRAHV